MTSCPAEEELVLFVEDDAVERTTGDAGDGVADHLVECAACRRLVARSEAALRYALAGTFERERVRPVADAAPVAVPVAMRRRAAMFGLAATAAAAVVLVALSALQDQGPDAAHPEAPHVAALAAPTLEGDVDALVARLDRLAAPAADESESDVALVALAAAQARLDLGMATGEARLRDVTERFAGTPEAREARALLASLESGR